MKLKRSLVQLTAMALVGAAASPLFSQNPETFVHVTTAQNVSLNVSQISNPNTDLKPSSIFLFTHNYSAKGTPGIRHDTKMGWYYSGSNWNLYNEDRSKLDTSLGFNILIPGVGVSSWTVTADTASNASVNQVMIDHGMINGDSTARIFVNSIWNLNGSPKGVYNTNTMGIYYNRDEKRWYIFNQDVKQKMIHGASFNIIVLGKSSGITNMVHSADKINSSSYSTFISHPDANDNPDAHIFITQFWNPNSKFGKYNNREVGVYYDEGRGRWAIFNENLVKMDSGVAFNVMIFPNKTANLNQNEMKQSLHLFPNPVDTDKEIEINISNPVNGIMHLTIADLTGKIWHESIVEKQEIDWTGSIPVSGLPLGIYILQVQGDKINSQQKFMVK